ncbi:hypothetical protein LN451_15230, partial [Xanthomonas hortorum pv. gardneri]|nr:hypothetical protein [Xanthomonas hortorum pv. gardneri]
RPAALKALAKLQREGKPAKPAKKRAGAATVATVAAKILPSDRAQLKLRVGRDSCKKQPKVS